jgi:hypothetical protein
MDENPIEHDLGVERELLPRLIHAVTVAEGSIHQAYVGTAEGHRIVVYEITIWDQVLTLTCQTGAGSLLKGPAEQVRRLERLLMGNSTLW